MDSKQKFCHNCGNQLDDGVAVCIKCGSLVGNFKQEMLKHEQFTNVKKVFSIVSVILAIIVLSVWSVQLFSGFFIIMYDWAFWLTFSLTLTGAITGLVFGILSKDKLSYCLNTAGITVIIMLLINWLVMNA